MKVYIAHYDNGESWEDHHDWYGDNVYRSRDECEREILKARFRKKEDNYYIRGDRYSCYSAKIDKLNFIDCAT